MWKEEDKDQNLATSTQKTEEDQGSESNPLLTASLPAPPENQQSLFRLGS